MNRSETIGQIAAALARAQGKVRGAIKDSDNPYFRSRYADLASVVDAIREAFSENEIAYVQGTEPSEREEVRVETLLMHSSGEWLSSVLALPVVKADAQGYGSALTYARRYGLSAAAGVAPEDDDGNAAANRKPEAPEVPAPMRNAETANAFMPRAKPVVERQPAPPARPVARKKPPVDVPIDPDPPEEDPRDQEDPRDRPVPDETPPAAGLTVFQIGGTTYATRGISQEQMLTTYELVPQVDRAKGRGTSRALLKETAGVETRTDLTEAQASRYIAALRELL